MRHGRRGKGCKSSPKHSMNLPDLNQARLAVLNRLPSKASQRGYRHATDELTAWYCSEPRLGAGRSIAPEENRDGEKGRTLQFRAEIFILLNRANFGTPNPIVFSGTAINPSAGLITNTVSSVRRWLRATRPPTGWHSRHGRSQFPTVSAGWRQHGHVPSVTGLGTSAGLPLRVGRDTAEWMRDLQQISSSVKPTFKLRFWQPMCQH
jgi:hypothetical protein